MNRLLLWVVAAIIPAVPATAEVTVFTSQTDWHSAMNAPTTQLTFQGIGPSGTFFQNQYASLGVTDPEPNDWIQFELGRWTLQSFGTSPYTITLSFDSLIHAIGWTSPFDQLATFYAGDQVVAANVLMVGDLSTWPFAGLVSDAAFDRVVITHPGSLHTVFAAVDDVWFETVPSPSTLALIGLSLLGAARRRRDR